MEHSARVYITVSSEIAKVFKQIPGGKEQGRGRHVCGRPNRACAVRVRFTPKLKTSKAPAAVEVQAPEVKYQCGIRCLRRPSAVSRRQQQFNRGGRI